MFLASCAATALGAVACLFGRRCGHKSGEEESVAACAGAVSYTHLDVYKRQVLVTSTMAYAVSKEYVPGMKPLNVLTVFTMFFAGGLIPTYMLYMDIHLIRTYWVMVLPYGLSVTYFIIMRNYFSYSVPKELEDAARIDGCNDIRVFFRVILPLSKPMLAAVGLFIAVGFWNDYYSYMMYIANKPKLQPLSLIHISRNYHKGRKWILTAKKISRNCKVIVIIGPGDRSTERNALFGKRGCFDPSLLSCKA